MAVDSMDDLASHSFELVNRELVNTLDGARRELEDYVDGRSGKDALLRTAEMLHIARGALKIVEIHGAALLAEEMELTCRRLAETDDPQKSERAVEALTRAMVQLPAYLERLLGGGKDVALVLLPLLNDLRQARDKPSLSEGTLVLLNSGPFERHIEARSAMGTVATDVTRGFDKVAQRLRPAFQASLLGWIKGADSPRHLDELLRVSMNLERVAASEQVKQLWAVITAVLTAIRGGGLEATVTLKRLIGQADRQLKRLIDGGESALVSAPPVDLVNSLLYYVARATSNDPRIKALREKYHLSEMLPGEEQLEQAREGLAGPSVKLMRTVAHAIKEDLAAVKDALDIFVRTGMQEIDKLAPQLEMLKKIGDTLGVLGIDKARGAIQRETQELTSIVASRKTIDRPLLEKMAATLLAVEDTLDRELVRVATPGDGEPHEDEASGETQQRQVTQAVMGECTVNLAKIKEAVIQLVEHPGDLRPLELVKPQLRGIVAGLLMLNKTKAVKVVERIGDVIATRLAPSGTRLKPDYLERLADSIVSVEYYLETVTAGRADPWYMLDNAERCLDLLEKLPEVKPAAPAAPAAPRAAAPAPTPAARQEACAASRGHAGCRRAFGSGARRGFHRRGQGRDREHRAESAALGRRSRELRGADHRPPFVPHAEGQRTHGRRAADRRVLVEHREPAEPTHQPNARADACHGGVHPGGQQSVAATDRAARDRARAEGRRAAAHETGRSVRRRRSRRREPYVAVAAHADAGRAARGCRARTCAEHGSGVGRYLRQGDAWTPRGRCATFSAAAAAATRAAHGRRTAVPRVSHAARQRAHGGICTCNDARGAARRASAKPLRSRHRV